MSAAPWITDRAANLPTARTRTGRTKGAVTTQPRTSIAKTVLVHAVAFGAATAVFYGFFSLMGHSLYSSAMKQHQNAELRADGAQRDVLELGKQVNGLLSVDFIDQWAKSHGFVKAGTRGGQVYVSAPQQKQG